jgi:hypothetical protein
MRLARARGEREAAHEGRAEIVARPQRLERRRRRVIEIVERHAGVSRDPGKQILPRRLHAGVDRIHPALATEHVHA